MFSSGQKAVLAGKFAVFSLCAWNAIDDLQDSQYLKAFANGSVAAGAAIAMARKLNKYNNSPSARISCDLEAD